MKTYLKMTRSSSFVTRYLRYWLPVLLWMGVIFVASSQPQLPFVLNKTVDFITKKAGHVTEYGVLAFLLWRAISRERMARFAIVRRCLRAVAILRCVR